MKYTQEDIFDGPMESVVAICLDRSRDVKVYPNITKTTVKSKETKGHITKIVVETVANGDIPPALRKIISPKMLTWIEYGIWDDKEKTYEYKVKTLYFSNITNVGGKFFYTEPEAGKCKRRLEGYVEVNMPLLGKIVEKKVSEVHKENLVLDVKAIRDELKQA